MGIKCSASILKLWGTNISYWICAMFIQYCYVYKANSQKVCKKFILINLFLYANIENSGSPRDFSYPMKRPENSGRFYKIPNAHSRIFGDSILTKQRERLALAAILSIWVFKDEFLVRSKHQDNTEHSQLSVKLVHEVHTLWV